MPDQILNFDKAWIYKVAVLADHIARQTSAIAKSEAELNLSQWRVLAAIADRPGRSARDVVAVTPMDKGLVSRACASLIEKGLLDKRASPSDGRVSFLYLSVEGERVYRLIMDKLRSTGADGQSLFTKDENAAFLKLIDKATQFYPQSS